MKVIDYLAIGIGYFTVMFLVCFACGVFGAMLWNEFLVDALALPKITNNTAFIFMVICRTIYVGLDACRSMDDLLEKYINKKTK